MDKNRLDNIDQYFEELFSASANIIAGQIEYQGNEAILKYRLHWTNSKLFLYGAGRIGFYMLFWLKRMNIPVYGIIDASLEKKGTSILDTNVISIEQFAEYIDNSKGGQATTVLITACLDNDISTIRNTLIEAGASEVLDSNMGNCYDAPAVGYAYEYYLAREDFRQVLHMLEDEESKETLCEILRIALYNDFYRLNVYPSCEKYWGDGFFTNIEDECVACLGGGIGDTIFYFLDYYNSFEKFYCFEPENMNVIRDNISVLPNDVFGKISIIEKYASDTTDEKSVRLDDFFKDKKITLITMDIERMEKRALKGARRIIKEQHPVLAISAYHCWDDIIQFVKFIQEVDTNYKFFFRKYAALYRMNCNETVLYAVPTERLSNIR